MPRNLPLAQVSERRAMLASKKNVNLVTCRDGGHDSRIILVTLLAFPIQHIAKQPIFILGEISGFLLAHKKNDFVIPLRSEDAACKCLIPAIPPCIRERLTCPLRADRNIIEADWHSSDKGHAKQFGERIVSVRPGSWRVPSSVGILERRKASSRSRRDHSP